MSADLSVQLGPLRLNNPLVAASGTFGYGFDYAGILSPESFGAVVLKGTAPVRWPGNPPPRVTETPSGMLNAIGLENPGIQEVLDDHLPRLARRDVRVVLNVVGRTVQEYVEVAQRAGEASRIDALELNISCPNVKAGGMSFGTCSESASRLVRAVRDVTNLPLIVKLTPNVTDIVEIALAVQEAGADVISLINTLTGMEIDVQAERPVLGNVFGGLSGPAIRPVALRCVWQVYESVDLPILGMGGVTSARDVLAFMMAGATAVGMGTTIFAHPLACSRILQELREYRAGAGEWPVGRAHGKVEV